LGNAVNVNSGSRTEPLPPTQTRLLTDLVKKKLANAHQLMQLYFLAAEI